MADAEDVIPEIQVPMTKRRRCIQASFKPQPVSPSPTPPDPQVLPPLVAQCTCAHLFKHIACSITVIPRLHPSLKCKFPQEQRHHLRFIFLVIVSDY